MHYAKIYNKLYGITDCKCQAREDEAIHGTSMPYTAKPGDKLTANLETKEMPFLNLMLLDALLAAQR